MRWERNTDEFIMLVELQALHLSAFFVLPKYLGKFQVRFRIERNSPMREGYQSQACRAFRFQSHYKRNQERTQLTSLSGTQMAVWRMLMPHSLLLDTEYNQNLYSQLYPNKLHY